MLSSLSIFSSLQARFRGLEQENADVKFLNTAYAQKVHVLEVERDALKARLERVAEANLKATVQTEKVSCRRLISVCPCVTK